MTFKLESLNRFEGLIFLPLSFRVLFLTRAEDYLSSHLTYHSHGLAAVPEDIKYIHMVAFFF